MQDADTDVAVDSGASFDTAFATTPEPAPAGNDGADKGGDDGQPRDEAGRFAAKAEAEAEAAANAETAGKPADAEDDKGGQIPSWRLREIREERDKIAAREAEKDRELEVMRRERAMWQQQIRQQRQAQEAPQRPDPINDPEGFSEYVEGLVSQRVQSVEESNRNNWVNLTFAAEHEANGETFEKAMQALEAARSPQIVADIREAVNPGKALMRWYRRQTAMTEVGDDIEGYNKRLREQFKKDPEFRKEFMADLENEARGGSNGAGRSSNVTSLPSVNQAPGSAGNQRPGGLGDTQEERFGNAFAPRSRRA